MFLLYLPQHIDHEQRVRTEVEERGVGRNRGQILAEGPGQHSEDALQEVPGLHRLCRHSAFLSCRGHGFGGPGRVPDPVGAVLEAISGQRDTPPCGARQERLPTDIRSRAVQCRCGTEERCESGAAIQRREGPHRRQGAAGQTAERGVRADLQERVGPFAGDGTQRRVVADGLTGMAHEVARGGRPAGFMGPAVERADEAGPYGGEGGPRQDVPERVEHRFHGGGVEGAVHREAFVRDAPVVEHGAHPVHHRVGTGQDLGVLPVGHGRLQAGVRGGQLRRGLPVQCHGHHGSRLAVVPHQQAPARGEFEAVGQRQGPGREERGVLSDAVAGHGPGADARLVPEPDQGALQGEERRLRRRGRPEGPGGVGLLGDQARQYRFAGEAAVLCLAGVEHLTYDGKPFVELRRRSGA